MRLGAHILMMIRKHAMYSVNIFVQNLLLSLARIHNCIATILLCKSFVFPTFCSRGFSTNLELELLKWLWPLWKFWSTISTSWKGPTTLSSNAPSPSWFLQPAISFDCPVLCDTVSPFTLGTDVVRGQVNVFHRQAVFYRAQYSKEISILLCSTVFLYIL